MLSAKYKQSVDDETGISERSILCLQLYRVCFKITFINSSILLPLHREQRIDMEPIWTSICNVVGETALAIKPELEFKHDYPTREDEVVVSKDLMTIQFHATHHTSRFLGLTSLSINSLKAWLLEINANSC